MEELEDFDEANIKDVETLFSCFKCMGKSNLLIYIKKKMEKIKASHLYNLKITKTLVPLLTK